MINRVVCFSLFYLFFLAGCASIPKADSVKDLEAKKFLPVRESSVIYVYRDSIFGGAIRMDAVFDDILLGEMRYGHYMRIVARPGKHIITSRASDDKSIEITTHPGQIYFVHQEATFNPFWYGGTTLNIVDNETGRTGVNDCELVIHKQPRP